MSKKLFGDDDEVQANDTILELPTLDDDPVSNESSFRISNEIYNRKSYIEDFESLIDMAGD